MISRAFNLFIIVVLAALSIVLLLSPAHASGKPLSIYLSPSATTITEGQSASFTLSKSGGNGRTVSVKVTTSDGSWSAYVTPGTSFAIPTTDDSLVNGTRTIVVTAVASTGATAQTTITELDNDVAPVPTPVPTPTAAEPVISPNGIKGEFDIADNFDVLATLMQTLENVPPMADPVGAFRFAGLAGQLLNDDPIVFPGQPGKSHLHQFFGNTGTNANSTYQSLRTTGGSTFTRTTDVSSQRSAYWEPAMLDGAGNAVKPNYVLTYYKQLPNGLPECNGAPDATHMGWCIPMPNGMRVITGYNMSTGVGNTTDPNDRMYWATAFECITADQQTSLSGSQHSIAAVVATGKCNVTGALFRMAISFPTCWDGVNLDTADHRSHLVFGNGALIDQAGLACPADHPYNVPEIALQTFYTIDANFLAGNWHLSSDEMVPGAVAGSTLHADYWEAWSPAVKNDWQTFCINAHLSCNVGELGNGQSVKGMNQNDIGPYPNHVLVPLSSIP